MGDRTRNSDSPRAFVLTPETSTIDGRPRPAATFRLRTSTGTSTTSPDGLRESANLIHAGSTKHRSVEILFIVHAGAEQGRRVKTEDANCGKKGGMGERGAR